MADEAQNPAPSQPTDQTPEPAAPPPSAAAEAALKAAKEAIEQAKGMQAAGGVSAAATAADDAAEQAMMAMMNSGGGGAGANQPSPQAFELPNLAPGSEGKAQTGLDLIGDVQLQVKIELGRTKMLVEDVLRLGEGSVVELDKLAGDPVDVYVNDRPVARGEVLVLNDNFCIRINEILPGPGEGEGRGAA